MIISIVHNTFTSRRFRPKFRLIILLALLLCPAVNVAQDLKASQWRFGTGAGLDFTSGAPHAISPANSMFAGEGSVSMADTNGNLLFYSNGYTVWNANNVVMANGNWIDANGGAPSQMLAVQKPGSASEYYMLYRNSSWPPKLAYSLIDMSLQGGNGDVIAGQKNVLLDLEMQSEAITAINHSNGQDVWICYPTRGLYLQDSLRATLLTSTGFGISVTSPASSEIFVGSPHLKLTSNGTYSAIPVFTNNGNKTLLNEFDPATGVFSNPIYLPRNAYGIEFSCNGKVLYVIEFNSSDLYQYDLASGDSLTIVNSETLIANVSLGFASAQLGIDEKIYIANIADTSIHVIHDPNVVGVGCNYQANAQNVSPGLSHAGFPGFNTSCFACHTHIQDSLTCLGDTTHFYIENSDKKDSILWDFGDPGSGALNADTGQAVDHHYSLPGVYLIQAVIFQYGVSDTAYHTVEIIAHPSVNLGVDTSLCSSDSISIMAGDSSFTYLWDDGSTDTFRVAYPINTIWVEKSNVCGVATDTLIVDTVQAIFVDLGPDTVICSGDSILLTALDSSYNYLWQNGIPDSSLIVYTQGIYAVTVSNACFSAVDSIQIDSLPNPFVQLGNDTGLCEGDTIQIISNSNLVNFLWQDSSMNQNFQVLFPDTFWVEVSNACGVVSDTIVIDSVIPALVNLPADTSLCVGDTLELDATVDFATYIWQDSSTNATFSAFQSGTYWCESTNGCGMDADTIELIFQDVPIPPNLGADTVVCVGDTFIYNVQPDSISSVLWSDSSTLNQLKVSSPGNYWVSFSNQCGSATDSVEVTNVILPSVELGNDTTLCVGETIVWWLNEPSSSYLWQDGSIDSSLTIDSSEFVWVEITNACGTISDSIQVDYLPYPFTDLGPDSAICENDSVTLEAAFPGASYVWFNASTDSINVVKEDGYYWVAVTNMCGTFSDSIVIQVEDTLQINLGPDTILCTNDSLLLNTYLDNELQHFWQDGSQGNGFLVVTSNQYWVMVSNTCGPGSDTIVVEFEVSPQVELGTQQQNCLGDSVILEAFSTNASYAWNTNETNSSIVAKSTGAYQVTVTNLCGAGHDSVYLEFQEALSIDLGEDVLSCIGETEVLAPTINQPVSLTWSNGETKSYIRTTQSGNYWVTGTNACGPVTDSVAVIFNPIPFIRVSNDTVVCDGDVVSFIAEAPSDQILWSTTEIASQIDVFDPGIYWAEMKNNCGLARDTVQLLVRALPTPNIGADRQVCLDEPVDLGVGKQWAEVLWMDGSQKNMRRFFEAGEYSIQVWDEIGCTGRDTIVLFECPSIWIPNAFTPRGDQLNEVFKPVGRNLEGYRFQVFNRWGTLIFETTDLEVGWNGMFESQQAPVGSYVWKVSFINRMRREEVRTGSVTLIR